jgi:hypothetical protein
MHTVKVKTAETTFSIPTRASPAAVQLDPDYQILRWTDSYRQEAKARIPHTIAVNAFLEGETDKAISLYRAALTKQPQANIHGIRFLLRYGLAEALFAKDEFPAALASLNDGLAQRQIPVDILPLAHLLRAKIASKQQDAAAFAAAAQEVRRADQAAGGNTGASEALDSLQPPQAPKQTLEIKQ